MNKSPLTLPRDTLPINSPSPVDFMAPPLPTAASNTNVHADTNVNADLTSAHTMATTHNSTPLPLPLLTPPKLPVPPSTSEKSGGIRQEKVDPLTQWKNHRDPSHDNPVSNAEDTTRSSRSEDDDFVAVGAGGDGGPLTESDSEIDSIDSDTDSTDDEFGKASNPKMDPKTRDDLEAIIFEGKVNTTLRYQTAWKKACSREDLHARQHWARKYAWDMLAGGVNQLTSFGLGGLVVAGTGNPWLFPVVAVLASDLLGDRLAQITRKSTIVANVSKEHFENQRRIARALGDLFESCAGKEPKKKFVVVTGKDTNGHEIKEKMTAAEALRHYGRLKGLSSFCQNMVVRSLPFLWFQGIYSIRDYILNYRCHDTFFPTAFNSSLNMTPSYCNLTTTPSGAPNPVAIDSEALRWGVVLSTGFLAGAATAVTNQLIASCLPHSEITNYSADTWKLKVKYLESASIDTKNYLDKLSTPEYGEELSAKGMDEEKIAELVKAAETLQGIQKKELELAKKKSSAWTTYRAELDLATQKHRDATMISPEFGGKRLDLILTMLGKFLSLLAYAYYLQNYDFRNAKTDNERLTDVFLVPMSLIVLGYALRDDCRLVGHLPYGAVKGSLRACKALRKEAANAEIGTNLNGVQVPDAKQATNIDGKDDDDDEYSDALDDQKDNDRELDDDGSVII